MVLALILHTLPASDAGPLTRLLAAARSANASRLEHGFKAAGATVRRVDVGARDSRSFGSQIAALAASSAARHGPAAGCVIAGSGAVPLARAADLLPFVAAAAGGRALANNRYSADIIAVPDLARLAGVPDLAEDNALPRWLEEVADTPVGDLRGRWRLQVDLDSPLDLLLVERAGSTARRAGQPGDRAAEMPAGVGPFEVASERLDAISRTLADRRAEVLVAGRTSSGALRVLETRAAARVRAWIEERGMRASTRLAVAADDRERAQRPPRSILGLLLDRDGPEALGTLLAGLADAAVVDTRILLAHRLGSDERAWPSPEDRFASDLLLADRIADPWLRATTASAAAAPIPIALGGHTLVGPGSRLLLRQRGVSRV